MLILASLDDLIELRKLRRARKGIDVTKLNKGEPRKRKKNADADDGSTTTPVGLIKGKTREIEEAECVFACMLLSSLFKTN